MTSEERENVRAAVERASGATELGEVTTFRGFRNHLDGSTRQIRVEVHDEGPNAQDRYSVVATDEEHDLEASGNPGGVLVDVLREVHWQDLDK